MAWRATESSRGSRGAAREGGVSGREGVDQQRSRYREIDDHGAKRADKAPQRKAGAGRRGEAGGVQKAGDERVSPTA